MPTTLAVVVAHRSKGTQIDVKPIAAARQTAEKRYEQLGLRTCAGRPAV